MASQYTTEGQTDCWSLFNIANKNYCRKFQRFFTDGYC